MWGARRHHEPRPRKTSAWIRLSSLAVARLEEGCREALSVADRVIRKVPVCEVDRVWPPCPSGRREIAPQERFRKPATQDVAVGVLRIAGRTRACAGVDTLEAQFIGGDEAVAQESQLKAPAVEGGGSGAPVAPAGAIRDEERPGARANAIDVGHEDPPAGIVAEPSEPWLGRHTEVEGGTYDPRRCLRARTRRDPLDIDRGRLRKHGAAGPEKLLPRTGFGERRFRFGRLGQRVDVEHMEEEPPDPG